MADKLNKKELDKVSGGSSDTYYFFYNYAFPNKPSQKQAISQGGFRSYDSAYQAMKTNQALFKYNGYVFSDEKVAKEGE